MKEQAAIRAGDATPFKRAGDATSSNNKARYATSFNKSKQPFSCIELFAGAGGLALGIEMAGFDTLALIEYDRDAAATLKANRPGWNVICDDVANISPDDLPARFRLPAGELDLLSGGAP
ncbi:MAG: DNA cytosine methyltransferase, partial [Coriobacteriaceae bacterium]|nr:DNA cytosine methyltransferase [Coriobacteriaceae bacterium]